MKVNSFRQWQLLKFYVPVLLNKLTRSHVFFVAFSMEGMCKGTLINIAYDISEVLKGAILPLNTIVNLDSSF